MPEEETIDNIEEAGGYPYQVKERLIAHMIAEAEEETARSIAVYERRYADVMRNWREKGKKHTMPTVPVAVSVDVENAAYVFSDVPSYPKPEPWTVEPTPVWNDEVAGFGPEIPGSGGAYYVTVGKGTPGEIREHNGKSYRLIVIGERGHIVYVRMWVPV